MGWAWLMKLSWSLSSYSLRKLFLQLPIWITKHFFLRKFHLHQFRPCGVKCAKILLASKMGPISLLFSSKHVSISKMLKESACKKAREREGPFSEYERERKWPNPDWEKTKGEVCGPVGINKLLANSLCTWLDLISLCQGLSLSLSYLDFCIASLSSRPIKT